MSKPLCFFVNDTSAYHCGSWAATMQLIRVVESAGYDVQTDFMSTPIRDQCLMEIADLVFANGEGTTHHDRHGAIRVMTALREAQARGKRTVLANAVWQGMSTEWAPVIQRLDQVAVRDPLSQLHMQRRHGRLPECYLDAAYFWDAEWTETETADRRGRRVTDLYEKGKGWRWPEIADETQYLSIASAHSWNWLLSEVAKAQSVDTGRFHVAIACLKTRTPCILRPGNSHKMEGLKAMFGRAPTDHETWERVSRLPQFKLELS